MSLVFRVKRSSWRILLLLMTFTVPCAAPHAGAPPQSLGVEIPAGEFRPFILANRAGTYFYGCNSEKGWDSGWMGLWVNRKRVLSRMVVLDSQGDTLRLGSARCRVTPSEVTWIWERPQANDLTIFFVDRNHDHLCYASLSGVSVSGGEWFVKADLPSLNATDDLLAQLSADRESAGFTCSDEAYSRAVAWAHLQLLFLLANNDSLLYAGIPWFNEGWGRDTFISLPGLLVTGHADIAKKLLLRFAGWIDRDQQSPTYGRIPNRVRPGEDQAYNTADGTPWWILGVYCYGLYAHDYDLWKLLLAADDTTSAAANAVRVAIEGALARCDSLGFLMHDDADTWMDAVGPDGPKTPRGNRAVEIQALHYATLDAVTRMAAVTEGRIPHATLMLWREQKDRLRRNFLTQYLSSGRDALFDHLSSDGSPNAQFRPNQLFAITVPLPMSPLVPPEVARRATRKVSSELVHPFGVLSLSPFDDAFHPFHQDEHYPKDDAYHNGIVWTWLSGPAKTALVKEGRGDLALKLAEYEAGLILSRGCVGTLPEVTDAMPRKGKSHVALSGTVSQAWSLAEFLRTTYQDLLGIRPLQVPGRVEPFWLFDPRIPQAWGEVTVRVTLEQTPITVRMQNFGDSMSVVLSPDTIPAFPIGIKAFDVVNGITGVLNSKGSVHLTYDHRKAIAYADGVPTAQLKLGGWPYESGPLEITFAPPIRKRAWPSLRPPPWDVLSANEVLRKPSVKQPTWIGHDSIHDDDGSSGYTYPLDTHFAPGILDIVRAEIRSERNRYHFSLVMRDLVQPGWHPEYGFQLTFAAICLHTPNAQRVDVGANSNYAFTESSPFSRIIYVGGGLRVEDDEGRILATFTPRTAEDALGDTSLHLIRFTLPKKYFPPSSQDGFWTILIGAQDDHGGAGLGEFRTVKAAAGQWAGGGNLNYGPNVYDTLEARKVTKPES